LFNRDLPTVRDALGVGATIALLKGRANYVCHYHLERSLSAARLATREEAAHLRKIVRFAERTRTGRQGRVHRRARGFGRLGGGHLDARELPGPGMSACQGLLRLAARQDALVADVVVVNHHLFFADVMLKDEGMGELLPACNTIIFDEAHQLPEVAGLFFGESLSTSQIIELARDTRNEGIVAAKDYPPCRRRPVRWTRRRATCAWR
jgi:ATP-dependent DNA helicase DinG